MLLETKISRRAFLQSSAAPTFSFTFAGKVTNAVAQGAAAKFNAWVSIAGDGTVTVMMPAAEMGQGALTSLSLILADELDADWSRVTTQYAPPIPKIYGNDHPLFNGAMLTAASVSTPGYQGDRDRRSPTRCSSSPASGCASCRCRRRASRRR